MHDITGQKFNRWTAIAFLHTDKYGNAVWDCLCDCGQRGRVPKYMLSNGHSKSCGCFMKECVKAAKTKHGHTANGKPSRTWHSWRDMKMRCDSDSDNYYPIYKGRGITVCDRWRDSFSNFLADMGERPKGTTLDRINGKLGYSPTNCRWADHFTQANNRSNNVRISYNGQSRTIAEWARVLGFTDAALRCRLEDGWPIEKALTTPVQQRRKRK